MSSKYRVVISIQPDSVYRQKVLDKLLRYVAERNIIEINERKHLNFLKCLKPHSFILFNFDNSLIIPRWVLKTVHHPAYNFHTGSPEYPGRDAHHFAIYNRAKRFGATLHEMNHLVDDGTIVRVRRFPITITDTPSSIWHKSLSSAYDLFVRSISRIVDGERLIPSGCYHWVKENKGTRRRLLGMCKLEPSMDRQEMERRIRAFTHPDYENIYVEHQGLKFFYKEGQQL